MFLKYFSVLLIYLFNLIYCATIKDDSLSKETFIIRYFEGRKIVPVKVDLDFKNQTEIVQILSSNNSWISISLHDFTEGTQAYKDLNGQCFVSITTSNTIEDDRIKLRELNNGIVKGYYIPTFYVLEDIDPKINISEKFGERIAKFCKGCLVSLVSKDGTPLSRKKRQVASDGEKGKITHHSYGHYGHQSNNYAHYGHDTRITGTIDKDGNIKDQIMNQYQERSQSSQTYPLRPGHTSTVNGINAPQPPAINGRPYSSTGNGRSTFSSTPTENQNIYRSDSSRGSNHGRDSSGQFSLQTAQESGYQLNLPFGLQAGNAYRGGISSSGQYGASRGMTHNLFEQNPGIVDSGLQRYPSSSMPGFLPGSHPGSYIPTIPGQTDISKISPPMSRTGDQRSVSPGDVSMQYGHSTDRTKSMHPYLQGAPDIQQAGKNQGQMTSSQTSLPGVGPQSSLQTIVPEFPNRLGMQAHGYNQNVLQPGFGHQPGFMTPSIVNGQQAASSSQSTRDDRYSARPSSVHELKSPGYHPSLTGHQITPPSYSGTPYKPGVIPDRTSIRSQPVATGFQPSSLQSIAVPGGRTASSYQPISPPGTLTTRVQPSTSRYLPSSLSGTDTTGGLPITSGYRPGSPQSTMTRDIIPHTFTAYPPGSSFPGYRTGHILTDQQRFDEAPKQRVPQVVNGDLVRSNLNAKEGESRVPSYDIRGTQISQPIYTDSQPQTSVAQVDQQIPRHVSGVHSDLPTNLRAFDSTLGQPSDIARDRLQGEQIASRDFPSQPSSAAETGEQGYFSGPQIAGIPSYNVPDSSSRTISDGSRTGINDPVITSLVSGDSASSQTQVQTGAEGTAAEASSAGNYRGVGSKTQVQGGYAGNGSFSAQAQSGFTGGITQSQVQGGKQGGLSGSSAIVENLGSAQSQVQIGKPSGSASSTAQGRFAQGMTGVRAQSGRTGGSAGAESQSRGLSSSQVQVDIAGKEASEDSDFQGTVSASVLGGSSSGQSQTQLQGGYNTGRTYAATAQGGFDASIDYQGSVPTPGVTAAKARDRNANIIQTSQQPASSALPVSIPVYPPQPPLTRTDNSRQTDFSGRAFPFDQQYSPGGKPFDVSGGQPSEKQPGVFNGQPSMIQPGVTGSQSSFTRPGVSGGPPSIIQPGVSGGQSSIPQPSGVGGQPSMIQPGVFGGPPPMIHPGVSGSQSSFTRPDVSGGQPSLIQPGVSGGQPSIIQPSTTGVHPSMLQPSVFGGPSSMLHSDVSGGQPSIARPSAFGGQASMIQYGPSSGSPSMLQPQSRGFQEIPSQPTQSIESQERYGAFHPSLHRQVTSHPSSPVVRTQNGFLTPQSTVQFGHLPYVSDIQNGRSSQTFSGKDQSAVPDTKFINYPQPYSGSRQYQPSLQVPSTLNGYEQPNKLHPPTSYQPTSPAITSSNGSPPTSISQTGLRPPGQTSLSGFSPAQISSFVPSPRETSPTLNVGQHSSYVPSQPIAPQPSTTGRDLTSQQRPGQSPGVREPDSSEQGSCCEALRNLKQRCCGRTTQTPNGSCCSSIRDDIIQDFEDEDTDTDTTGRKEPCKVVKAVCYIVYKPVGKARICKPTSSNSC